MYWGPPFYSNYHDFYPNYYPNPGYIPPIVHPYQEKIQIDPPKPQNLIKKRKEIFLTREDLENSPSYQIKNVWTTQEDEKLCHLIDEKGLTWGEVQKQMPQRNYKMCYSRYKRIKQSRKFVWTPIQDSTISRLVQVYGKKWTKISKKIKDRNPKQIRERYTNFLRPNLKNDDWSVEQELKLVELVNKYGKRWKKIEDGLETRSLNQIKNRYFNRILKVWKAKKNE